MLSSHCPHCLTATYGSLHYNNHPPPTSMTPDKVTILLIILIEICHFILFHLPSLQYLTLLITLPLKHSLFLVSQKHIVLFFLLPFWLPGFWILNFWHSLSLPPPFFPPPWGEVRHHVIKATCRHTNGKELMLPLNSQQGPEFCQQPMSWRYVLLHPSLKMTSAPVNNIIAPTWHSLS